MAADGVDCRPIAPTLAGHLANHALPPGTYSIGNFLAQIKIPPHTLVIGATEGKNRLGVRKVYRVLDVAAAVDPFGIEKLQVYSQRFQFLKLFGETNRVLDADGLLQSIFRTGPGFLVMHIVLIRRCTRSSVQLARGFDAQERTASRRCLRMARR